MTDTPSNKLAAPPPELRFRRKVELRASLKRLWRARPLVRSLAERDLRARYKQALLGFGWAVVPPLATVIVFTVLFDRVADIDTKGTPYVLFSFLGLLPWTFFSSAVAAGANSLLGNVSLLNKVKCPREVFPVTAIVVSAVDAGLSVLVLIVLFAVTGRAPRIEAIWAPLYLAVGLAFTVAVALLTSIVVVYLRDLRHALPLMLQLGLFATPVVYGLDVISPIWVELYVVANPLAAVIDGYRRTILLGLPPDWLLLVLSATSSAVLLVGSYALFRRLETGIADVA